MGERNISKMVLEQPEPIRKQVYEQLRNWILDHTITPSSRLVEAQIAKKIGISRTPIREALHLLEKDGFVESIPRVGYFVKKLTLEELDEIFEIRLVIEKLVCARCVEKITDQSIAKLANNIGQSETALRNNTVELYLKLDEEFHEILVQSTGSNLLFNLCQQLRRLMLRYRAVSIKSELSFKQAVGGHVRIVDCLRRRDIGGLQGELIMHLKLSKEDISKQAIRNPEAGKAGRQRGTK